MISFTVTCPSPVTSPQMAAGVGVDVFVAVGVLVGVGVDVSVRVAVGVSVGVGVPVGRSSTVTTVVYSVYPPSLSAMRPVTVYLPGASKTVGRQQLPESV